MSQYSNLPGVNMNVKDGQLLVSQDNTTNSLMIIAEAKAAARITIPEEPVLVRNEADLVENFGGYFYQGELNPIAAEWAVAKEAGVRNIYLLALRGATEKERYIQAQDMLFNVVADLGIDHVVMAGLYADENIEGLTAADFGEAELTDVEGVQVYHTRKGTGGLTEAPAGATLGVIIDEEELAITLDNTVSGVNLVKVVNRELKIALNQTGLDEEISIDIKGDQAVLKSTASLTLEGVEVLEALGLTGAEEVIEGYGNPAALLSRFAQKQSTEASDVIGYISVKPVGTTNLRDIKAHTDRLIARNNDVSKHIQVVAGPPVGIVVPGSLRIQWLSGVTQYAALVNQLAPQSAPTNQTLPQVRGLRYNLSLRQLDALVGNKYVTFRVKNNRIVVVDGVTTAPDLYVGQDVVKSDFTRLSTLRIVNYMVRNVREALDAFIGSPNEFEMYTAMNTAIKSVIKDAIANGVIIDANYSISLGDTLDSAAVTLTILPQFELRTVDVTVGLTTPEGFDQINS